MEEVKTTRIYEKDLTLLKTWMEKKNIENSQEALRIRQRSRGILMMPQHGQQDEKKIQTSRSELIWGVVLYGIIMWVAGFVLATAVL